MFYKIVKIKILEMIVLSNLQAEEYKNFKEIKKIGKGGTEYWNEGN